MPKLVPAICREKEREGGERQRRAGGAPKEAGSVPSNPVLNTRRVSMGSQAFPQGLGQRLWVTPKAHSPPSVQPTFSLPHPSLPSSKPSVPPSTHHLCPPVSTCSHLLPPSRSNETLLAAQVAGSLPENPNVYLFLGMCRKERARTMYILY